MNALRELFIAGLPQPQGSKDAFRHPRTGRIIVKESAAGLAEWRQRLVLGLRRRDAPYQDAVRVTLRFVLHRPIRTAKTKPTPAATAKPDLDKLVRAVLDAGTIAEVWRDDAQVTELATCKHVAELGQTTGVWLRIEPTNPRYDPCFTLIRGSCATG